MVYGNNPHTFLYFKSTGNKCLHSVPCRCHQCPEKLETFKLCHGIAWYNFLFRILNASCGGKGKKSSQFYWPPRIGYIWEVFQISHKMLRNLTSLSPESSRTKINCRQSEIHQWENDFCYTRLRFTKCGLSKLQETYLLRGVTYKIVIK
jgi:hypothetical protein